MIVDVTMQEIRHNSATSIELTPLFRFANMEKKMQLKLKKLNLQQNGVTEDRWW